MSQLVEQLLQTPEARSSNAVIDKNLYWTVTVNCIEKEKIKKKSQEMVDFLEKKVV